jgi:ABC-type antimicrobial peptide transport system permease subunit
MALVMAEGAILGLCGAAIGLLLGRFLIDVLPDVPVIGDLVRGFPKMNVPPVIEVAGILIGLSLGLLAGLFPSVFAYRARITELLRHT